MANCMICNVEFDPAGGGSKNFCTKHSAPAPSNKGIFGGVDVRLSVIIRLAVLAVISVFIYFWIDSCAESHGRSEERRVGK